MKGSDDRNTSDEKSSAEKEGNTSKYQGTNVTSPYPIPPREIKAQNGNSVNIVYTSGYPVRNEDADIRIPSRPPTYETVMRERVGHYYLRPLDRGASGLPRWYYTWKIQDVGEMPKRAEDIWADESDPSYEEERRKYYMGVPDRDLI